MVNCYAGIECEELHFSVHGVPCKAWAFSKPNLDRALLLPQSRTGMILSTSQLRKLRDGCADEALLQKAVAYGCSNRTKRHEIRDNPPRPEFLMIDVTTRCNLNCSYCLRHFPNEGANIPKEKLRDILDYILRYCDEQNLHQLSIQPWGGEPLLAVDEIFLIHDTLKEHGIHVNMSIQTNGMLLTKELLTHLHNRNIRLGVSIDGCQEIHDIQRKAWNHTDSYSRVCEGIRNLKDIYGENFGTISVVTHDSIPYLEKTLDVFCKDLGILSSKFNPVHPNGETFDRNMLMTDCDIDQFISILLSKLISLNESGYSFFESNIRDKLINLLCGKCGELCHGEGCTGGYSSVTFARDGSVYPCELIGHQAVRIGSIYDGKSLTKLLSENIPHNKYFCSKHSEQCLSCPWWTYCRGGCTASCMSHGRDWGSIDQTECTINRILYPKLIELILEKPEMVYHLTNQKLRILG